MEKMLHINIDFLKIRVVELTFVKKMQKVYKIYNKCIFLKILIVYSNEMECNSAKIRIHTVIYIVLLLHIDYL